MKLKYYMRGLGIGIIVTALMMGISGMQKEHLSDDEIRTRAAMLGMVDGGKVLSSLEDGGSAQNVPRENGDAVGNEKETAGFVDTETQASDQDMVSDNTTGNSEEKSDIPGGQTEASGEQPDSGTEGDNPVGGGQSENPEGQPDSGTEGDSPAGSVQPEVPEDTTASEESTGTVTFTVQRGQGSETVCYNLTQAGLVDDAAAFNRYLIENGYSQVISAGTFEIPQNASWEEIAQIITRRR